MVAPYVKNIKRSMLYCVIGVYLRDITNTFSPLERSSEHFFFLFRTDFEKLQRENETLRDKHLCKICMECDVEVIFYPCKHFVCCVSCGATVSVCPICRVAIESIDKVFMA